KLLVDNSRELDRLLVMLLALYQYRTSYKELKKEPCDMAQIVRQSVSTFAEQAAQKRIEVTLNLPEQAKLICDCVETKILIGHLIDNAIKYGRSKVAVSAVSDGQTVTVEVADDGRGIDRADMQDLFKRFHQISS